MNSSFKVGVTHKIGEYSISYKRFEDLLADKETVRNWFVLSLESDNLYAFYQSPLWIDYTLKSALTDYVVNIDAFSPPLVIEIRDHANRLVCLTGVIESTYKLNFAIKSRQLFTKTIPVVKFIGGAPLLHQNNLVYNALFESIFVVFPHLSIVHVPWLPLDTSFHNSIQEYSRTRSVPVLPYMPNHDYSAHYSIIIQNSFKEYAAGLSYKTRYQVNKSIKKLKSHYSDQLEIVRVDSVDQVESFLDAAAKISRKSWQGEELGIQMSNTSNEREFFTIFAEHGLLRSYLLVCGSVPCAFVRGFQYGDVFYYSRACFDRSFAACTPGKVLLYYLIEDLHSHNRPHVLNFQEGQFEYKRHFATVLENKTDLLLIKNKIYSHIINRSILAFHNLLGTSKSIVKKKIRQKLN